MCDPLREPTCSVDTGVRETSLYTGNPINGVSACQKFFSRNFRTLYIWTFAPGTLNIHMQNKPNELLPLLVVLMMVVWIVVMCSGCMGRTKPAKQQKIQSSSITQSIPVAQLDQDQDGHISSQEQQLIISTPYTQHAIVAFVVIMCVVIVASVGCAWMSNKCKRNNQTAGRCDRANGTCEAVGEPAAPASEAPAARD